MDDGEDEVFLEGLEALEIERRVFAAGGDEGGEFFKLRAADGGLHFADLEVVAEVGINVLVVVAVGEFTELPVEPLAAGVADARLAPAIAAPVAHGKAGLAHAALVD